MTSFHELLREKLSKPKLETAEETVGCELSPELIKYLLRWNSDEYSAFSPRENAEIPASAAFYRQESIEAAERRRARLQEMERQRQKNCQSQWRAKGKSIYKAYEFFVSLGEWNFAPDSKASVRAAYHRLLLRFHPDHNPESTAAERTREIITSFRILQGDAR